MTIKFRIAKLRNESNRLTPLNFKVDLEIKEELLSRKKTA